MTPAQLDHLRAIDAHLTALLDLAAKRTPGEWKASLNHLIGGWWVQTPFNEVAETSTADFCNEQDAAFIAACAGRAEAGWRATLLAITGLQSVINMTENPSIRLCAEAGLKTILSAWPLELLTLP